MQNASLILGILGVAFLFVPGVDLILSPMLGVAALVTGMIGATRAARKGEEAILGKAGAVTGGIALFVGLCLIAGCFALIHAAAGGCSRKADVSKQVERKFEALSRDMKKDIERDLREELSREVDREVAAGLREERGEGACEWYGRPPMTPDAWEEEIEVEAGEWLEWLKKMPVARGGKAVPPPPGPAMAPPAPPQAEPGDSVPPKETKLKAQPAKAAPPKAKQPVSVDSTEYPYQ